ncbi:MAG TPA: hypothetical protein VNT75_22345 [Symbiobacteriaceae bacterium]|nr:hypothetical protein [Symbiobacteriaceae bacterium]
MAQSRGLYIKTTQVHDWCCKNSATTLTLADLAFPANMADVAGVECEMRDFACAVLARSPAVGGVTTVTLRKQVRLDLTFVNADGEPVPARIGDTDVTTQTRTRFWDEFIKIAAPVTAEISCELTDAGCRTTLTLSGGVPAVTVELFDVQSITAEESVRMQVDAAAIMQPAKARLAKKPYLTETAGQQ